MPKISNNKLQKVCDNIWVLDGVFSTCGCKGSTRMTIIRLNSGELFVHSPISITTQQQENLQKLGEATFVVAPNNMHYLYLKEFLGHFPQSQGFVTRSLQKKNSEFLGFNLVDTLPESIQQELEIIPFKGHSLGEFLFYHQSTETLVTSDLFYNIDSKNRWFEKVFMKIIGAFGKATVPFYHKFAVKDKSQLSKSMEEISALPIQRIIMAHGQIYSKSDAKERFLKAWRKFL